MEEFLDRKDRYRFTVSVLGRIRFLIVSMIIRNGTNTVGVFWGTRCSDMSLVFLIRPNNRSLIHSGRAKVSVSVKCLVLVKMYENCRKLFVKTIRNNEVSINEFRLFSFLCLRIVFIT